MMSTTDHELRAQRSYVRQLIRAFAVLGVGVAVVVPLILYWTSLDFLAAGAALQ